jgi:Phosphatidylserine decarboxylase
VFDVELGFTLGFSDGAGFCFAIGLVPVLLFVPTNVSNERMINILQTRNFGKMAFVEVGALSVGRIVQVHPFDAPYYRGQEKSVFRFGGSAIVVFGQAEAWRPVDDILSHTRDGIETLIRLGEPIAQHASVRRHGSARAPFARTIN